ncbi:hypothetical protein Tco_1073389, partial [Tanacetum coccineum]
FDRHPPTMMEFLKNKDGIEPLIRYLWYVVSLLVGNMSKYSTPNPPVIAFSSSSRESSYFLLISLNITSPTSSFIDGSGGEGGVVLMFLGFLFSSRPSSSDLSSQDLFGFLGHIVMALIELWIRVEHWGSFVKQEQANKTREVVYFRGYGLGVLFRTERDDDRVALCHTIGVWVLEACVVFDLTASEWKNVPGVTTCDRSRIVFLWLREIPPVIGCSPAIVPLPGSIYSDACDGVGAIGRSLACALFSGRLIDGLSAVGVEGGFDDIGRVSSIWELLEPGDSMRLMIFEENFVMMSSLRSVRWAHCSLFSLVERAIVAKEIAGRQLIWVRSVVVFCHQTEVV